MRGVYGSAILVRGEQLRYFFLREQARVLRFQPVERLCHRQRFDRRDQGSRLPGDEGATSGSTPSRRLRPKDAIEH